MGEDYERVCDLTGVGMSLDLIYETKQQLQDEFLRGKLDRALEDLKTACGIGSKDNRLGKHYPWK
jgi:hypothetical protein